MTEAEINQKLANGEITQEKATELKGNLSYNNTVTENNYTDNPTTSTDTVSELQGEDYSTPSTQQGASDNSASTEGSQTGQYSSAGQGLFDLEGLMDTFYGWEPGENDQTGNEIKSTFMANAIQSSWDTEQAKDLAYTSAEVSSGQMRDQANLELRNNQEMMRQQAIIDTLRMGDEYDYNSRFAVDESNRELNKMAMAGDVQQNQTMLEGKENRLNMETSGAQELLQIQENQKAIEKQGTQDVNKIEAQQTLEEEVQKLRNSGATDLEIQKQNAIEKQKTADIARIEQEQKAISAQGSEERLNEAERQKAIGTQGKETRTTELGTQYTDQGIGKIGAQGLENRANITAQSTADISRIEQEQKAIGLQGSEERLNEAERQKAIDKQSTATQNVDTNRITNQSTADKALESKKQEAIDKQATATQSVDTNRITAEQRAIGMQGDDTRKTMREEAKLKAQDRMNQSKTARNLAGMF